MITRILKKPGLILLIILLTVITIGILKPGFFMLGWDNFSSYLNLPHNILSTLFPTWRQHRGLGVPSDAEINDIPRQIFSLIVSLFLGKQIVDQLYMAFMLWGGVLGMYMLGRYISRYLKQNVGQQELFGFIAAFFYLFNLSTLAIFYFPMIMYNTRFFMLPALVYIFLNLIHRTPMSKATYFLYLLVLFVGFGAYMVPTIFIVTMIMLALAVFIFKEKRRLILAIVFYVAISMYWILPFVNYTVQKSAIVPSAPTFLEINEAMLNKPKSYYSFEKQAKLRPSFFEIEFTNNGTKQMQAMHELAGHDEKGFARWVIWIFPVLYLLGAAYVFLFFRNRLLIWLAITTLIFLILSMKEYSPLGFAYDLVSDHVPFANTIFRFGDTKFHAMIAFGGSILSAFLLTRFFYHVKNLGNRLLNSALYTVAGLILVSYLFVYKSYFNGNMIGFFMYNKIPSAYFEIADIINKDPDPVRVIQLPFDSHGYWKPYTWGYFGSAFLHFMLNKPIFDRSFEPASMENAAIHRQILDILTPVSSVLSDDLLEERALDLYRLLKSLSIKYVIDDQTVSVDVDSRSVSFWGSINADQSGRLLSYLAQKGYLKLVKKIPVASKDYAKGYEKLFPYNKVKQDSNYSVNNISLYEISQVQPRLEFLYKADKVHTGFTSPLPAKIRRSLAGHYIQAKEFDNQSLIYPFSSVDNEIQINNDQAGILLPVKLAPGTYVLESKNSPSTDQSHMINVFVQKKAGSVMIYLQDPIFPTINQTSVADPSQSTTIEVPVKNDSYQFVLIGNVVLPIDKNNDKIHYIGSVLTHDKSIPVRLLYPQNTYDLSGHLVQRETNPQCFNDALANATSHITGDNGILKISGQNVSNCLTTETDIDQTVYAQLEFEVQGTMGNIENKKSLNIGKPLLKQYIGSLDNPLTMQVCVKPSGSTVCLNNERLFRILGEKRKYLVPIVGDFTGVDKLLVTFAVRSGQKQSYQTTTTNINLKTFSSSDPKYLAVNKHNEYLRKYNLQQTTNLIFTLPVAKPDYSQTVNLKTDGIMVGEDPACQLQNNTQLTKETAEGFLNYAVGCRNFVSKNIPFSSDNFYMWSLRYKHFAGSIPAFILMDKINTYYYQKLWPPQINANDYFSLSLQKPEPVFSNKKNITKIINQAPTYTIHGYIEPQFDIKDNVRKEMIVDHFTQNEGLIGVNNLSLIELPNYWTNSRLQPLNYETVKFDNSKMLNYHNIFPSLWKIKAESQNDSKPLLFFNEQYDKQWVIIGAKTLLHTRCDGLVNCYKIYLPKGQTTFYLFYLPEILNIVGITITLIAIAAGFLYVRKNRLS